MANPYETISYPTQLDYLKEFSDGLTPECEIHSWHLTKLQNALGAIQRQARYSAKGPTYLSPYYLYPITTQQLIAGSAGASWESSKTYLTVPITISLATFGVTLLNASIGLSATLRAFTNGVPITADAVVTVAGTAPLTANVICAKLPQANGNPTAWTSNDYVVVQLLVGRSS